MKCKGKKWENSKKDKKMRTVSLPVKMREGKRGKARVLRDLPKAAQGGPHYDIKQDLISESDLMR